MPRKNMHGMDQAELSRKRKGFSFSQCYLANFPARPQILLKANIFANYILKAEPEKTRLQ